MRVPLELRDLHVLVYALDFNSNIKIEYRGVLAWAITRDQVFELNVETAEFDLMPSPSNRDGEYLATHRFSTAQDALDHFNRALPAIEGR